MGAFLDDHCHELQVCRVVHGYPSCNEAPLTGRDPCPYEPKSMDSRSIIKLLNRTVDNDVSARKV